MKTVDHFKALFWCFAWMPWHINQASNESINPIVLLAYFFKYEYLMRCTLWYALLHDCLVVNPIIREFRSSSSANCKTRQRLKVLLNNYFLLSVCFYLSWDPCAQMHDFTFVISSEMWAIQHNECSSRKQGQCFSFPIRWWASVGCQGWRILQRWPTTSSTTAFRYQAHHLPRSWTRWILRPWRSPWATLSSCKQNVSTASVDLTIRQTDINTSRQTCSPKHDPCWV